MFVELTTHDGRKAWINVDHINSILPSQSLANEMMVPCADITITNGERILVRETVGEVVSMLGLRKVAS